MLPATGSEIDHTLSNLIHDLHQPLSIIQDSATYLEMLLRGTGEAVQEQLRLIERQVDQAARILAEMSVQMRQVPVQPTGADGILELTNSHTAGVR